MQADLLIWYKRFEHFNVASVWQLLNITKKMKSSSYKLPKLFFCKLCIKKKMTCQLYKEF